MTDAYTKAVLVVIALALVVLAVRPIIDPGRVDAQGPNVRGQSGREGTDAGDHESVRAAQHGRLGGDGDLRPDPLQRPLRRAQVARPVVEDGYLRGQLSRRRWGGQSVPLVDGTPVTRGSRRVASPSARAAALKTASTA